MPKIIKKKIQKEARRYYVDEDDLIVAVNVINLESSNQIFDAELNREDIKKPNQNLWQAALRVQEFINVYNQEGDN